MTKTVAMAAKAVAMEAASGKTTDVKKLAAAAPKAAVPAPAEPTGDAAYTTDANGNITITGDGVFTISDSFTGSITIDAGKNVKLTQATPATALQNVNIVCSAGTTLHLENLNITTDQDMSIIDFKGGDNLLNLLGTNTLKSTALAQRDAQTNDIDYVDTALIHAKEGTGLSIVSSDSSGTLDISLPDGVCFRNPDNTLTDWYYRRGAGIGGSLNENSGKLFFYSGTVKVNNEADNYMPSAAIGGGDGGSGGEISIFGGNITAQGGDGAAIGSGRGGGGGKITIWDGTVSAFSGTNGAAIGGGKESSEGEITIYSGKIDVTSWLGAGIGGGYGTSGGTINISGGEITSTGLGAGAGIGGGMNGTGGIIEISGGSIIATADTVPALVAVPIKMAEQSTFREEL